MDMNSTFSRRLKDVLNENNQNISDLSKQLNISKQSIYAYMNGTRSPKAPVVAGIASKYGVSVLWLSGYNVEKYDNSKASPPDADLDDFFDICRHKEVYRELCMLAKEANIKDVKLIISILDRLNKKK